ncbi:MAG: ribosome maturation factor RimM [Dissulfuribacterales bacterium]
MEQKSEVIAIGRVCKPHGIRGELVLSSMYSNVLRPGLRLVIGERHFELLSLREAPSGFLVRLKGVLNRSDAEALSGSTVYVSALSLPQLPDGEFYWHEVIGLRVVAAGVELGRVVDILQTGAHDIYVVHSEDKKEYFFPAVEDIVTRIDVQHKVMFVDPPDGLLDIDAL